MKLKKGNQHNPLKGWVYGVSGYEHDFSARHLRAIALSGYCIVSEVLLT